MRIEYPACCRVTKIDNNLFASRVELSTTFPIVRIIGNVEFVDRSRAARLGDHESHPFR